jgi:hypothetical protein
MAKRKGYSTLLAALFHALSAVVVFAGVAVSAQTVSPIITEYNGKGEGTITLANNTLSPLVVTIEAQSFSINPDGRAIYRPLDPSIHVSLSTTSVRLEPKQQYFVFYKTHADSLPAWFTVFATFSQPQRSPGLNVRIMLPHTVYLYQKQALRKTDVRTGQAVYVPAKKVVECEIENVSTAYGRMREGHIQQGRESAMFSGFPLLPSNPRSLEIPWTGKDTPEFIFFHFDHFDIKLPVTTASSASDRASN